MWQIDEWVGCYPSQWKGMIVPEAMKHPAKFSNKLIRRIYEHMKTEGWVKTGDRVVDPFGGVALGALDAMRLGLQWTGCELEPKFVELGNWNISHWIAKYHSMPNWGSAMLLQGDSRKLGDILRKPVSGTVSSPPYVGGGNHADQTGAYNKNGGGQGQGEDTYGYGKTPGQMGQMKAENFDAAITSPPFEERSADGGWQMFGKYAAEGKLTVPQVKGDPNKSYPSWSPDRDTSYGETEGQMGQMKSTPDGFQDAIAPRVAISSPPYAETDLSYSKNGFHVDGKDKYERPYMDGQDEHYGSTDGQLGAMKSDQFDAAVSSSPYNLPMSQTHNGKRGGTRGTTPSEEGAFVKYGNTDGQLEGMKSTDETFTASLSSPPFLQSEGGTPDPKPGGVIDDGLYARHAAGNAAAEGYGADPANLGNMKVITPPTAAISSPPYTGDALGHSGGEGPNSTSKNRADYQEANKRLDAKSYYGDATDGNLGNDTGDDFWLAARRIVEQVYMVLEPGGHAVWVCKDFVKNKQRAPFSDQWRQLCEAVGFVTLHEHHALLVHGKQIKLDGTTHYKESKSFFRRNAEKKGSPRIDFEVVWCMEKPL